MIEAVTKNNIEEVLPLIRQYQEFYNVVDIDEERNKVFFSQFGDDSEQGCLFSYHLDNKVVAFASVYFSFSSAIASKVAIMNDLYTLKEYRRRGVAKALIKHCEQFGKSKGSARLQWLTAADNKQAQSLYHSLGAKQSSWEFFTYST